MNSKMYQDGTVWCVLLNSLFAQVPELPYHDITTTGPVLIAGSRQ